MGGKGTYFSFLFVRDDGALFDPDPDRFVYKENQKDMQRETEIRRCSDAGP